MRDVLAERLLAKVMKWSPEDVARERPDLQALAAFKYDEYQQFSPGMRFVESLALWLAQFDTDADRGRAYHYVRSRLIFISSAELTHLVAITFPDAMRQLLIRQTASHLSCPEWSVTKICNSMEFRILLRQSLFLGLSDGAHVDLFRRANHEISHEQVWQTYDISKEKAEDMLLRLASDLKFRIGREATVAEKKFRMVFLLDDFSGSGLSYLRKEGNGTQWAGKVNKVFRKVYCEDSLNNLVSPNDLHICIVLYVATAQAYEHITEHAKDWLREHGRSNRCTVLAIQIIPESVRVDSLDDGHFIELLKKYFDSSIVDEHYRKGKYGEPYLGFDHCALPVILNHNTPNNSLPLLWFEEDRTNRGLFPRVRRHGTER